MVVVNVRNRFKYYLPTHCHRGWCLQNAHLKYWVSCWILNYMKSVRASIFLDYSNPDICRMFRELSGSCWSCRELPPSSSGYQPPESRLNMQDHHPLTWSMYCCLAIFPVTSFSTRPAWGRHVNKQSNNQRKEVEEGGQSWEKCQNFHRGTQF